MAGRTYNNNSIGQIIKGILKDRGMDERFKLAEIEKCYHELMGPYISKKTRKISLRGKTLIIYLDSGVLKEEFSFSKSKIPALINERLGEEVVQEVEIW
jgi:predicted nucleic acid-binding Zn ribbon protein